MGNRTATALALTALLLLAAACGGGRDEATAERAGTEPIDSAGVAAGAGGGTEVGEGSESDEPTERALDQEAQAAYQRAKEAFRRDDLAAMQAELEAAVSSQPDFTEAWYNLGACRGERALAAIRVGDEQQALALFRSAVDAKREAKALMDRELWWIYRPGPEQDQVRYDVEQALADAEEVLADEASLLGAMRLMAMMR